MMFYRGISHHEAPAEYVWKAPDGTEVLASRFALYCRYNWYYQVHRSVSRNRVWSKDYKWGEFDEAPFRRADGFIGPSINYDLKAPVANYEKENLKKAILDMLEEEKGHFTTPVFLGMNGHDISVGFPRESKVIKDAKKLFKGEIDIEHTNLEKFWEDAEKYLDKNKMTVLTGERRSYLKEGKWTYLFPGTISARTYLKQADFNAYTALTYIAEPLNALAVMPKGLFEYEVFDDSTMALTLIRACRIKLAVSEEKVTELEDEGVQCPGNRSFEYAIQFNNGNYNELPNKAAEIFAPVKCAVCGRGKGDLPLESSMISIDNKNVHITAIKQADDGNGIIVRFYNPTDEAQKVTIKADGKLYKCKLDERIEGEYTNVAKPKKIVTIRIAK